MNIQDLYELEILIVGCALNDRQHLKSVATMPEYFEDKSCRDVIAYISKYPSFNLYDMCAELNINFELATSLHENSYCDTDTYIYRVIKLATWSKVRKSIRDEINASQHALNTGLMPERVAEVLINNLGKLLEQGTVSAISH